MASPSVKLVVAAKVRETLNGLGEASVGKFVITRHQRQIMAHCFPYIDVKTVGEDEFLDQLREDIHATLDRLS